MKKILLILTLLTLTVGCSADEITNNVECSAIISITFIHPGGYSINLSNGKTIKCGYVKPTQSIGDMYCEN